MKQIGKSGLKSTELSAAVGELLLHLQPVGYISPKAGVQGWFSRKYPIEGKQSPAIRCS